MVSLVEKVNLFFKGIVFGIQPNPSFRLFVPCRKKKQPTIKQIKITEQNAYYLWFFENKPNKLSY